MQHEEAIDRELQIDGDESEARRRPFTDEELTELRSLLREVEPTLRLAIREYREGLGWSQARLARELADLGLKIDPTAITRIETGSRTVRPEELWALAVVLRCDIDGLIAIATNVMSPEDRLVWEKKRLAVIDEAIRSREKERRDQMAIVERLEAQARRAKR